jgi:hypothetical protein
MKWMEASGAECRFRSDEVACNVAPADASGTDASPGAVSGSAEPLQGRRRCNTRFFGKGGLRRPRSGLEILV